MSKRCLVFSTSAQSLHCDLSAASIGEVDISLLQNNTFFNINRRENKFTYLNVVLSNMKDLRKRRNYVENSQNNHKFADFFSPTADQQQNAMFCDCGAAGERGS